MDLPAPCCSSVPPRRTGARLHRNGRKPPCTGPTTTEPLTRLPHVRTRKSAEKPAGIPFRARFDGARKPIPQAVVVNRKLTREPGELRWCFLATREPFLNRVARILALPAEGTTYDRSPIRTCICARRARWRGRCRARWRTGSRPWPPGAGPGAGDRRFRRNAAQPVPSCRGAVSSRAYSGQAGPDRARLRLPLRRSDSQRRLGFAYFACASRGTLITGIPPSPTVANADQ